MNDDLDRPDFSLTNPHPVIDGLRTIGALLAITTIIIGIFCVVKIFMMILSALQNPAEAQPFITAWANALGGEHLSLNIQGTTSDFSYMTAISVLGIGTILLCRLSIAIITTGAKILAWTLGEKEAIKKILMYTFGPNRKVVSKDQ